MPPCGRSVGCPFFVNLSLIDPAVPGRCDFRLTCEAGAPGAKDPMARFPVQGNLPRTNCEQGGRGGTDAAGVHSVAREARIDALGVMDKTPSSATPGEPAGEDRNRGTSLSDLSSVVTAVGAGVGGLYLSTQSVVVTGIGAGLAAVLVFPLTLRGRRR